MKKRFNQHKYMVLGIFLVSVILLLPMFLFPYQENDDTWFHLMNIGLIKTSIETNFWNGFLLRILPFVGNHLGYGTRLFYPPLAHTFGAYLTYFLDIFHFDIVFSLKILHFITMFLSGLAMYFCAFRFHKDKFLSFLSSVIYMASSYHMCEIYVRDSLGESMLFIFLPLIIVSVKELLEGNKKLFYPCFIIGYVGGILSHFTMMIYITLILGVSMLFFSKKIFRKEFLIPFIKACIAVFLLTAFFFEPMFEHKLFGHYMVYKKWYMSWGIYHTTLYGIEYLFNIPNNPISYRFSFAVILLLFFTFKNKKKEILKENYFLVLIFLGISFVMSTRLFFPWLFFPYLLFMIQFGWRLVLLVIFGVALIAPIGLKENKNTYLKILILVCVIASGLIIPKNDHPNLDLEKISYGAIMGWQQEYLPEKIGDIEENKTYFESRDTEIHIVSGNGLFHVLEDNVPYLKFEIVSSDTLTIELPRIFYFGYVLKNANGDNVSLYENEKGFLEAEVSNGTYELTFEGTLAYKICIGISITTFIGLLFYSFYFFFQRNKIK